MEAGGLLMSGHDARQGSEHIRYASSNDIRISVVPCLGLCKNHAFVTNALHCRSIMPAACSTFMCALNAPTPASTL
jgi:hypothetical protein